jgi:sterol desaturase/sphingolipid hydroxylase (fatty acid hydroxylase superfamily)
MNNEFSEPSKQISEIRDIMQKSSRFISLSGLSGISAGVSAILGVLVSVIIFGYRIPGFTEPYAAIPAGLKEVLIIVITDALLVAMLAISTAVFFTARKASARGVKAWDSTSRRLIINMLIP